MYNCIRRSQPAHDAKTGSVLLLRTDPFGKWRLNDCDSTLGSFLFTCATILLLRNILLRKHRDLFSDDNHDEIV